MERLPPPSPSSSSSSSPPPTTQRTSASKRSYKPLDSGRSTSPPKKILVTQGFQNVSLLSQIQAQASSSYSEVPINQRACDEATVKTITQAFYQPTTEEREGEQPETELTQAVIAAALDSELEERFPSQPSTSKTAKASTLDKQAFLAAQSTASTSDTDDPEEFWLNWFTARFKHHNESSTPISCRNSHIFLLAHFPKEDLRKLYESATNQALKTALDESHSNFKLLHNQTYLKLCKEAKSSPTKLHCYLIAREIVHSVDMLMNVKGNAYKNYKITQQNIIKMASEINKHGYSITPKEVKQIVQDIILERGN